MTAIMARRRDLGIIQNVTTAVFLSLIVLGLAQSIQPMRWMLLAAIAGCVVFAMLITINRNEHGFGDWAWALCVGVTIAGLWAFSTHLLWMALQFLGHL